MDKKDRKETMLYILGVIGFLFLGLGLWMGVCMIILFWKLKKSKIMLAIMLIATVTTVYYAGMNLLHSCFGFDNLPLTKIPSRYGW